MLYDQVDEILLKLRWFGGSGGGGGPAAEFRSQMISIMFDANTIRLRKGRGGWGSGGRVPQPNDKAKKGPGAANNSRNVGIPNHL